jgi:hypothetical protein
LSERYQGSDAMVVLLSIPGSPLFAAMLRPFKRRSLIAELGSIRLRCRPAILV